MSIALIFLFVAVVLNWLRYRDPLYPAFIQSVEWLAIMGVFWGVQDHFDPLHASTLVVIVLGVILFGFGCHVATFAHQPFRTSNPVSRVPALEPARFLVVVTVMALPFVVYKAYVLALNGPTELPLLNLRYAMTQDAEESGGYGMFNYVFPLAFFSAALQVMLWRMGALRGKNAMLMVAVSLACIYGVLSTGRGILVGLLMTLGMIPIVLRQVRLLQAAFYLFVISLLLFVVLGMLMGKGGDFAADFAENMANLGETFEIYLLASIPALDHLLQQGSPLDAGLNTFRTLFATLHAIGFEVPVRPLVKEFIEVPVPTNVYTLYQPYFLDFGVLALPLVQFVLGLIYGAVYRGATRPRPHPAPVYLYALLFWPLAGQFGSDPYFSLASQWVQYLVLCGIFMVWWSKSTPAVR